MRWLWTVALGLTLWSSTHTEALADKRVALVIGNGAYAHAPHLPNPPHDAQDVAGALERTGFEIILGVDLDQAGMQDAAIRFARAARTADVAVFYYSGHAMQFAGVNYLVPIDAELRDEADLRRMARVDDILADLQQAKNLRILVLDSCRDNPLAEQLKRSIGLTRSASLGPGLAKMTSPDGTIISYSTQSGQTAVDGAGRNSPYTAAFLSHIEDKEEIATVFHHISATVYDTTNGTQVPELSLSFFGEFYLNGKVQITVAPNASPAPPDPCAAAGDHWKSAEAIGTIAAYEDHLARFPNCAFASLAKARIESLKDKVAVVAPPNMPPIAPPSALGPCSGGVTVSLSLRCATLTVNAWDNIYGAGRRSAPGDGNVPAGIAVKGGDTLTFTVTGAVSLNFGSGNNYNDADGVGAPVGSSSNTGFGSISGIIAPNAGYLVGVFVPAGGPAGPPPVALNFMSGTSFTSLSPLLDQVFFIGDGLTGDGSGSIQTFLAPSGASMLYLGISDASYYNGRPGAYRDNSGAYSVVVAITAQSPPPAAIAPAVSTNPCGGNTVSVSLPSRPACPLTVADERGLKPKNSFKECDKCPEMVVVPAGSFTMGSPASEAGHNAGEGPQHKVTFAKPFAVGRFDVTVDQFSAFVKETGYDPGSKCGTFETGKWVETEGRSWRNPGFAQSGLHPATCLNWYDAKAYVAWLAKETGQPYRLLSEAEQEYVTRAGTTTVYYFGDDAATLSQYAWYYANSGNQTHPVGEKKPNGFGLYDMHGNVWQWPEDCYHIGYQGAPTDGSVWSDGDCSLRVMRGGSWFNFPQFLRSAEVRYKERPDGRSSGIGFRVARTLLIP